MMGLRLFGHGCGADGLGLVLPNTLCGLSASFRQNALRRFRVVDDKLHRSGGACARPPSGDLPPTEGGEAPTSAGADRRPGGSPCGKACPFSGRERPAHNAGRRAYRRFTAAFFLRPRDRLLETDRGPLYGKPLIPQSFSPCVHPPPPARCRTDPCSWAGQ